METSKTQQQLPLNTWKITAQKYGVYAFLAVFVAVIGFSLGSAKESPEDMLTNLRKWENEYPLAVSAEMAARVARCKMESEGAGIKVSMNAAYPTRFVYGPTDIAELVAKRDRDCSNPL